MSIKYCASATAARPQGSSARTRPANCRTFRPCRTPRLPGEPFHRVEAILLLAPTERRVIQPRALGPMRAAEVLRGDDVPAFRELGEALAGGGCGEVRVPLFEQHRPRAFALREVQVNGQRCHRASAPFVLLGDRAEIDRLSRANVSADEQQARKSAGHMMGYQKVRLRQFHRNRTLYYRGMKDPHLKQFVEMSNVILTRSVSEGKTLALADASG